MATPILETERLILRPLRPSDAPVAQKLIDNWNVVKFLSSAVPWPYPSDGSEVFYRDILFPEIESGNAHAWAITIREFGDELAGTIDFYVELKGDRRGNRGFWLAEQFWGNGYMTEAVEAVNEFVFNELKLEKFWVSNALDNTASSKLKSSGIGRFVKEAEEDCVSGTVACEIWEITRDDWLAQQHQNLPSANPVADDRS